MHLECRRTLRYALEVPGLGIKSNTVCNNSVPSGGPDTWGVKAWISQLAREPQQTEVLPEVRENREWGVDEGSYK